MAIAKTRAEISRTLYCLYLRVSGAFNQYIFSGKCINQILSFTGCCIKATEISRNVVVICRKEYLQHSASAAM